MRQKGNDPVNSQVIYLFIYSIFFRQGSPFSFATVLPRGPAHMNTNNNVKMQIKIYIQYTI